MVIRFKIIRLIVTHGHIIYLFVILVSLHSANGIHFKVFLLIPFKIIRLAVTHGRMVYVYANSLTMELNIQKSRKFGGKLETLEIILNSKYF